MKYASVCDGIGAAHVAWQPLGWTCEWTSEIDAFPSAVVEQRWGFPNRGDMTKFMEWNDGAIDLLVGGTPCQSFSVAGLRKGLHDPRGGLMLTFLEIAQRYRPRWVVWENVPGVLSSNGGRDFGAFLGALGELGYGWAYRVLDAQWFGVAQRRRRVFVVGCLGDERRAAQVLFERESVRRDNPPSRAKGQGATYDVAPCIGASGRGFERAGETRGQDPVVAQPYRVANCLTQRMHKGINTTCDEGQTPVLSPQAFYSNESRCDNIPPPDISPPVKIGSSSSGNPPAVAFKPSHYTRGKDGAPSEVAAPLSADADKGDQDVVVAQGFTYSGYSNKPAWITGDRTDCLPSSGHGDTSHQGIGVMQPVAFTTEQTPKFSSDRALTITKQSPSGGGQPQCVMTPIGVDFQNCANTGDVSGTLMGEAQKKGGEAGHGVMSPVAFNAYQRTEQDAAWPLGASDGRKVEVGVRAGMAVRRLTPRECERLQGFPDDYTAIEYRKKPAADGPRYKALGNSMAVPVMRWIGERISANEFA